MDTTTSAKQYYTIWDPAGGRGCEEQAAKRTRGGLIAACQRYAARGDYGQEDGTTWVDVYVMQDTYTGQGVDGEHVETITVQLDQDEPSCKSGEGHDWQSPHEIVGGLEENPGVWGKGGGVVIHACCMRCGARRVTDTWAQRPDTGQQGLESVSYDPAGYYELPAADEDEDTEQDEARHAE